MKYTTGIRQIRVEGLDYLVDHETEISEENVTYSIEYYSHTFVEKEIKKQIINSIILEDCDDNNKPIHYNINHNSEIGKKIIDELNKELLEE